MPRIDAEDYYNGSEERIDRLGLASLLEELREILTGFELRLEERKDANGGAAVRKLLDKRFERAGGWVKKTTGDIDWSKCHHINGARVCMGVEVQFSARSDLLAIDIHHLRRALIAGFIDIGVLVVPADTLSTYLTDRGPSVSAARRHIQEARAEDLPVLLISLMHDGPGPPLAKQYKRSRGVDLGE